MNVRNSTLPTADSSIIFHSKWEFTPLKTLSKKRFIPSFSHIASIGWFYFDVLCKNHPIFLFWTAVGWLFSEIPYKNHPTSFALDTYRMINITIFHIKVIPHLNFGTIVGWLHHYISNKNHPTTLLFGTYGMIMSLHFKWKYVIC